MSTPIDAVNAGIAEADGGFGTRPDGTPKGEGWLGLLKRPDGQLSTELTMGVGLNGKEQDIPLLVPTLDAAEVRAILALDPQAPDFFQRVPKTAMDKAIAHARMRLAAGKSPYADRD